jgi:diguanylate cyclase (GGDEF)-like protein
MTRPASLLIVTGTDSGHGTLSRSLHEHGYRIRVVADAMTALEQGATGGFDLVLLDMDTPGLNPFETLRRLRAERAPTELPVIVVTAQAPGEEVAAAIDAGANDYLVTPIDFPFALARIETHLAHRRAVQDLRDSEQRLALALKETKPTDALTGLPNRVLFLELVERAVKRAQRRSDYTFAIFVLSLDRLKVVHEALGPAAANRLLLAVTERLQSCLRSTDVVTHDQRGLAVARLSGDEFNLLIDDIAEAKDVVLVAERLRRAFQEPFEVDGHRVFTTPRIGIAVSTTGYSCADDVLRDAAAALSRAERSTYPCEVFDPAMRERALARLGLEADLRQAIASRAFDLHYQPIVSLRSGRIAGFEALVRWRHPERGLVLPSEFIGVAEDTGLIVELDRLILRESCRQMAAWIASYGSAAPQVMCANLSSRQLAGAGLMTEIAKTLEVTGLTPRNLKLEITENAFIKDVPAAQDTLTRARELGVAWSLDDFGTGYSSLSLLHRLKIDTVKVDQSFVSAMGTPGGGSEMVRAIVGLAHSLGLDVVAEGVESAEQAEELRALGCEYAQGFYFSKAVDTATAGRLIEAQPWQSSYAPQLVQ